MRYQTVASGVQLYAGKEGSRHYRINLMVDGQQLFKTVPGSFFTRVEDQVGRQLEEDEELLECQRLRLRLKKEFESGSTVQTAWEKTVGSFRKGIMFEEFALEAYIPDQEGAYANDNWKYAVKQLAREFAGRPVGTISYDEVRVFVNRLKRKKYSASRIRDFMGQLSCIFQLAVRNGLRKDNPVRRLDKTERRAIWPSDHVSKRAKTYAKAAEVDLLVQAAMMIEVDEELVEYNPENGHPRRRDTRWFAPIIRIAFETGMRRSEIFGLTWSHVCLEQTEDQPYGYISLDKQDTKTEEERLVPLSPAAADVLKQQVEKREGMDPIFVGRNGQASPDYRKCWVEVIRKAKLLGLDMSNGRLNGFHFHDLRASWAVDSLKNGANFWEVKETGGWESLQAMQRYLRTAGNDMESLHAAYAKRTKGHKAK